MHGLANGYVGLCRLPQGEVNVCGLFRSHPGNPDSPTLPMDMLRGAPGTSLHARLAPAIFDEASFCAVAGLSLRPQRAAEHDDCRLGDALTMIPPVTGNGMSMAFEAAELALEPLASYARGHSSWDEVRVAIARECDRAFRQRLAWAKWLQWMMFTPALRGCLGALALNSSSLWRLLFSRTR
jgi:menaquinone-9 beta-reductase